MPAWPSTLPAEPLAEGFSEERLDNRIVSSFDAGPPKYRRRSSANVERYTCLYSLTEAQLTALDTFYTTTVREVGQFDWPHPYKSGVTLLVRFIDRPQIQPVPYREFVARIRLETVPS